jgi:protocatechuate 3,4-dioxygenase beta subunit
MAKRDSLSTRRDFVVTTLGSLTGAAILGGCGGSDSTGQTATGGSGGTATGGSGGTGGVSTGGSGGVAGGTGGSGGGVAGAGGAGTCTVYPQETQGPFYQDLDLLRSDIREDRTGAELRLQIQVIRASDCSPLADVAVDIWQCDAVGVYSGFPGQLGGQDTTGLKWLRGTQITNAEGIVDFISVYPGWYPGRTTHIHFKVHFTPTSESVSQMYFPEELTTEVYAVAPYLAHGPKDTSNDADAFAHAGGFPGLVTIAPGANGYDAKLTIVVAS